MQVYPSSPHQSESGHSKTYIPLTPVALNVSQNISQHFGKIINENIEEDYDSNETDFDEEIVQKESGLENVQKISQHLLGKIMNENIE